MPRAPGFRALLILILVVSFSASGLTAAGGRPAGAAPPAKAASLAVRAWKGGMRFVSGLEASLRLRAQAVRAKAPVVPLVPASDLGPTMDPNGK
jgi:hypothetical protein